MAIAADVPARPEGVELIGRMEGSGYRTPPSLVRRHDGQTLQLTPLLYAVLEAVDGRSSYADIARRVSAETGRKVAASDVEALVEQQLRPMGLLVGADGSTPELERSNPLLGLRFKVAVTEPETTRRLTDPFTALFHPLIWVPIVLIFGYLAWWLLVDQGLAAATYQAFARPGLLLLVLVLTVLSAGFHEFGHAAAARRGGAQPGVMGAGMYLMWPAFYTDVTDSYRLGRAGRVRTDLGGLYFNAIVAVLIAAVWLATRWDALLLIIAAQIIQMARQLAPLVRFDGYHILADSIGVPDLFGRIGPILASFWPPRWKDPRVAQLKLWARLLVTAWVVVVVPILLITFVTLVLAVPRIVGTAWESLGQQAELVAQEWAASRPLDAIGAGLAMAIVGLVIFGMVVMIARVAWGTGRTLWRRTEGHTIRRGAATGLMAAAVAAVALAWWPDAARYRPIQPYERGTIVDLVAAPLLLPVASAREADGGQITTVLPRSTELPTEAEPQLALVLVPKAGVSTDPAVATDPTAVGDPAWVFPFDRPLPPEPGDNQAFAENTTDRSAVYDVAIAMVWVTGEDPVLNTNEAYAFASCADCVTVAVAFQVVVIVGDADVIVPQNLAGAVNYECFDCITAAIASQLVVTVDSMPGAEQQVALADIWDQVGAFADSIPTLPLAEVLTRLEAYKAEIVSVLESTAAPPAPSPTAVPSPTPTATAVAAPGSAMPEPSAATPTPAAAPTATPEPTIAPTASPTPTVDESPSPTPTGSAAPSGTVPPGTP
jgi:putative peptide zinc metalloprotease protein